MNLKQPAIFVLVCLLALLSCEELRVSAVEVQPGEEIQVRLKEGGDVFLTPDNVRFKFIQLVGESRCPKGATCIWGGIAEVRVDMFRPDQQPVVVLLWIPGLVTTPYRRNGITQSGYNITLLQLDPYPDINRGDSSVVYEALLAIEKVKAR
jgi:hypothetical protein